MNQMSSVKLTKAEQVLTDNQAVIGGLKKQHLLKSILKSTLKREPAEI